MPYEQKQRREKAGYGTIKKNVSDNPNAPIMKGGSTIDGTEYWVSLFKSRRHPGSYDLSFEKKDEQRRAGYEQSRNHQAPLARDDFDEFDR